MSSVLSLKDIKANQILAIARQHGVERVRVFGSVARGEAHSGSDVDLLIGLQPGHGFSDFMAFCEDVERILGRRVDVVMENGLSPYLRDRVLAEAIPL